MALLAIVSSPLPSSHVVYPVFFLNSDTHTNNCIRYQSPPWMVSPGAVPAPPPSDATVEKAER